jgi:hypothetical protein
MSSSSIIINTEPLIQNITKLVNQFFMDNASEQEETNKILLTLPLIKNMQLKHENELSFYKKQIEELKQDKNLKLFDPSLIPPISIKIEKDDYLKDGEFLKRNIIKKIVYEEGEIIEIDKDVKVEQNVQEQEQQDVEEEEDKDEEEHDVEEKDVEKGVEEEEEEEQDVEEDEEQDFEEEDEEKEQEQEEKKEQDVEEEDEEQEQEEKKDVEEDDEEKEDEEKEEEEEDEWIDVEINGKTYYTQNTESGDIHVLDEETQELEPKRVGYYKNGQSFMEIQ